MRSDYGTACAKPGCDPSDPASGPIYRWGNRECGYSVEWGEICCADLGELGRHCRLTRGSEGPIAKDMLKVDYLDYYD